LTPPEIEISVDEPSSVQSTLAASPIQSQELIGDCDREVDNFANILVCSDPLPEISAPDAMPSSNINESLYTQQKLLEGFEDISGDSLGQLRDSETTLSVALPGSAAISGSMDVSVPTEAELDSALNHLMNMSEHDLATLLPSVPSDAGFSSTANYAQAPFFPSPYTLQANVASETMEYQCSPARPLRPPALGSVLPLHASNVTGTTLYLPTAPSQAMGYSLDPYTTFDGARQAAVSSMTSSPTMVSPAFGRGSSGILYLDHQPSTVEAAAADEYVIQQASVATRSSRARPKNVRTPSGLSASNSAHNSPNVEGMSFAFGSAKISSASQKHHSLPHRPQHVTMQGQASSADSCASSGDDCDSASPHRTGSVASPKSRPKFRRPARRRADAREALPPSTQMIRKADIARRMLLCCDSCHGLNLDQHNANVIRWVSAESVGMGLEGMLRPYLIH
jgi:hypothetical protein